MKTYRVLIQPQAEADIEAAFLYIRSRSATGAAKWPRGIHASIESLSFMPHRCGYARENQDFEEPIRQLVYGKRTGRYRIIYIVRRDVVSILHVRHGAMDSLSPWDLGN